MSDWWERLQEEYTTTDTMKQYSASRAHFESALTYVNATPREVERAYRQYENELHRQRSHYEEQKRIAEETRNAQVKRAVERERQQQTEYALSSIVASCKPEAVVKTERSTNEQWLDNRVNEMRVRL